MIVTAVAAAVTTTATVVMAAAETAAAVAQPGESEDPNSTKKDSDTLYQNPRSN